MVLLAPTTLLSTNNTRLLTLLGLMALERRVVVDSISSISRTLGILCLLAVFPIQEADARGLAIRTMPCALRTAGLTELI